jgi:hypothetical protein
MTTLRSMALVAGLLGAAGVEAATFCASTASELENAIAAAQSSAGADEIRIRSGLILQQTPQVNAFRYILSGEDSVTISGGWSGSPGQCTSQSPNPALTILDGNEISRVLDVQRTGGSSGSFTLRNMTLRRGKNNEYGACLNLLGIDLTVVGENLIENLIVSGCNNGYGAGMAIVPRLGATTVRNVLLRDNTAPFASALYVDAQSTLYLSNLTIVDNVATQPASAAAVLDTSQNGAIFLSNSLLWNNVGAGTTFDLRLDGASTTLVRNLFGSRGGSAPSALSNNNLGVDPQFAADGIRLRPSSPARDFGANAPLGGAAATDLDGKSRVQGGRIDLGAYEIPVVFRSGFE